MFEDAGIDLENGGPLVSSCYNGIAACLIPLAADKLGVKLDGSSVYVVSRQILELYGQGKYNYGFMVY